MHRNEKFCQRLRFSSNKWSLIFLGGGEGGAWDSFGDLTRAMALPRKMHTRFYKQVYEVHRPGSQVKNSYFK